MQLGMACRLQTLRDNTVPGLQRKADSLEADCEHDNQRLEELQAEFALLEHELQVSLRCSHSNAHLLALRCVLTSRYAVTTYLHVGRMFTVVSRLLLNVFL